MFMGRVFRLARNTLTVLGVVLFLTAPSRVIHADQAPVYIDIARKLVDDRKITIRTAADVSAKRSALIRYVWGPAGFPARKLPVLVQRNVKSPVRSLTDLERVDTLHIAMDAQVRGLAHHFIPKKKRNRLVILHLGHSENCTFDDGTAAEPDTGMRRSISRLLKEGFSVLAIYMPNITIENCSWGHEQLFTIATTGSPMKFFLEPTIVSLNYLQANYPEYRDISMIGLSGGGWTTTVCAAIDPRISLSVPVAGSLPLYLCWGISRGDIEQHLDSFYRLAGYPDLYLLGAYGPGRSQIQVLNRHDDCCFGEKQHNSAEAGMSFEAAVRKYEARIKSRLQKLGSGSFRVYIDEMAPSHMISDNTIARVIIPALH
jgi:hypothetical protein